MQNTSNLNLKKPEGTDLVDINDLNDNADIIDGKFGSSAGHGHTGAAGDGPKITSTGLAAGAAIDTVIGNRTISDSTAPTGDSGTLTTLLGWLANMIKSITGKSSWRTAPAINLEATKTHVDDTIRHITASERTSWNAKASTAVATQSAAGLESAEDKTKLDGVAAGATAVANSASNGVITINGTNATVYAHPNHTGDVTSTGDGVTAIAAGVIVDADVNAAAAIAWSKLSKTGASLADLPTRSAGDLTSGTLPAARLPAISGDITIAAGAGTASITAGAIVNADINAGAAIDATKIGGGLVSSAEFGYLDGVMAPIQGQINGKANLSTTPQQTTADITYYVRTDGSDSNTGLGNAAGTAFKTIGKAISMIPAIVNHKVLINIAAGTYAEAVTISGYSGNGEITITGSTVVDSTRQISNIVNIKSCSCIVNLLYVAVTTTISRAFEIVNCTSVSLTGVTVNGANTANGYGIIVENADATIANCVISNKQSAIYSNWGALVYAVDCSGTGNGLGYVAGAGGRIQISGTVLAASTLTQVIQGGFITSGSAGTINPWGDNTTLSRSAARAWINNSHSLASLAFTKLQFNGVIYDQQGEYSTTLYRFTAKKSGLYLICGAVNTVGSTAANTAVVLSAWINGLRGADLGSYSQSGGIGNVYTQGARVMSLAAGDYVELYAYVSGSSTTVIPGDGALSDFSVTRIA